MAAAAAAVAPIMAAAAAAAAAANPFALGPGDVNPNAVIDFSSPINCKQYGQAIKPLIHPNNLGENNLKSFVAQVDQRATEAGWHPLFDIPENANANAPTINLISHYGQLTLTQVRAHAQTIIGTQTRMAQLDMQLALCLLKSFTKEARDSMELESSKFTINGVKSGILIFKVAQIKTRADSQFVINAFRADLRNLGPVMISCGQNVVKFNEHVRSVIAELAARNLRPDDSLYSDVMAGLMECTNAQFLAYIQTKQDLHDEQPAGYDMAQAADEIMTLAEAKYRNICSQLKWKPDGNVKQDEDIIALKDEIEKLKSGKSKKTYVAPAWKSVAPKEGQAKVKVNNGKTYHWCPNHLLWTIHKPGECHKIPSAGASSSDETNQSAQTNNSSPSLRLVDALSAIVQE